MSVSVSLAILVDRIDCRCLFPVREASYPE